MLNIYIGYLFPFAFVCLLNWILDKSVDILCAGKVLCQERRNCPDRMSLSRAGKVKCPGGREGIKKFAAIPTNGSAIKGGCVT
jgi:hypothetical protein